MSERPPPPYVSSGRATVPREAIARVRAQFHTRDLARLIQDRGRGYAERRKVEWISLMLRLTPPYRHGNITDHAVREAVRDLVHDGCPLGSVFGSEGGVWWITDEIERQQAMGQLVKQRRALDRRIGEIQRARLDWTPSQGSLF